MSSPSSKPVAVERAMRSVHESASDSSTALQNKRDLNKAIADYTRLLRQNPDDATAYFNRANARESKGDWTGAIADYREVIRLRPREARAYINLGYALHSSGDLVGAVEAFSEAILLSPDEAIGYINRGSSRLENGEFRGAIEDFSHALRLEPDTTAAPDIAINRGYARQKVGDLDGAIADYTRAVKLRPTESIALFNRGNIYLERGDALRALKDYNSAIHLAPDFADAYLNRGRARWKSDFAGALEDFARAVRLNPSLVDPALLQSAVPLGYTDRQQQAEDEKQENVPQKVTKAARRASRETTGQIGRPATGQTPMMGFRIPNDLQARLRAAAKEERTSLTELVVRLLNEAMDKPHSEIVRHARKIAALSGPKKRP